MHLMTPRCSYMAPLAPPRVIEQRQGLFLMGPSPLNSCGSFQIYTQNDKPGMHDALGWVMWPQRPSADLVEKQGKEEKGEGREENEEEEEDSPTLYSEG